MSRVTHSEPGLPMFLMLAVHIMLFGTGRGVPCCQATLKSETGKKPKPEIKENKFFTYNVRGKLLCELLPLKIREQVKRSLSVEICATHISSEGYDCENLRACLQGGRVPWLTGLPG